MCVLPNGKYIIPYKKKLGNYNSVVILCTIAVIIPYKKKLGNYNPLCIAIYCHRIIPYKKKLGNYNITGIYICNDIVYIYVLSQKLFGEIIFL